MTSIMISHCVHYPTVPTCWLSFYLEWRSRILCRLEKRSYWRCVCESPFAVSPATELVEGTSLYIRDVYALPSSTMQAERKNSGGNVLFRFTVSNCKSITSRRILCCQIYRTQSYIIQRRKRFLYSVSLTSNLAHGTVELQSLGEKWGSGWFQRAVNIACFVVILRQSLWAWTVHRIIWAFIFNVVVHFHMDKMYNLFYHHVTNILA